MKNELSVRQICMIFLSLIPINKLIMLPSIISKYCGEQLYIPLLINFTLDILVLGVFLRLNKRFPEMTFEEILTERFNARLAKAVYFLYGLFFLFKSLIPILEHKYYVDNTLYDVFPNAIAFLPLLLLSTYFSLKDKKTLGRSADIAIWSTSLGILLALLFSVFSADFTNMLPIFQKPRYSAIIASFSTITWFSDSMYMLLFLGHFKSEKNSGRALVLSYTLASIVVIIFAIVFYSVFGKLAQTQIFAINNMTIYTTKIINVGRFDYFASFLILFSGVITLCLPIFASTKCFVHAFNLKKSLIPSLVINIALLIFFIFFENHYFKIFEFLSKYLSIFLIFMAYILPLIYLIGLKRKKSEKI